jgi:hypothetical protein
MEQDAQGPLAATKPAKRRRFGGAWPLIVIAAIVLLIAIAAFSLR